MSIQLLPPDVAGKIAAGEVVERPANVAKELIENSLDAAATEIRVEIREGGQRLLRVTDNGRGIPGDELPLALRRHATSKVHRAQDLTRIETFGFRGEALYSIAAVSHLTLSSRHQDEEAGVQVRSEGGQITHQGPVGLPVGTVVTVEHIFFNTPARRKFLRRPATEAGHISAIVQRYALAHPERRFSLISEGRLVFQSTGSGRVRDVLAKVYGLDNARQMIGIGRDRDAEELADASGPAPASPSGAADEEISFMQPPPRPPKGPEEPGPLLRVGGFVSLPTLTRANRNSIDLFVNRRYIEDRSLTHAVIQAYHTLLPVGRFPVAVIFIQMDPQAVDVNVHPRKTEVRFQDGRQVFSAVQKAVRRALLDKVSPPHLTVTGAGAPPIPGDPGQEGLAGWAARRAQILQAGEHGQQSLDLYTPPVEAASPGGEARPASTARGMGANQDALPPLRVVGQVGATYIVAEGPEGLYLIDQHAAHERIMYEKFMAQRHGAGVPRQGLLDPLTLHVGDALAGLVVQHLEELAAVGFEIEPFGGDAFLVRTVPGVLANQDGARALEEIVHGLAEERDLVQEETEARLVKMVCKRASIKAGQVLSDMEMKELVRQLEACRSPRTCPHGRPTMIQLSAGELEKAFKRT